MDCIDLLLGRSDLHRRFLLHRTGWVRSVLKFRLEDYAMIFEPAFPDGGRPGMCMRDYIAIKAMAAFLESSNSPRKEFGTIAADAYRMADAMLDARRKEVMSYQV